MNISEGLEAAEDSEDLEGTGDTGDAGDADDEDNLAIALHPVFVEATKQETHALMWN